MPAQMKLGHYGLVGAAVVLVILTGVLVWLTAVLAARS